mmetsp:Transcript_29302/g.76935  ORF Transcript_29302/g.76935 Transcript_29302/m.76935 type:complete len:422 (-) Transcript_29302:1241-2506(-)
MCDASIPVFVQHVENLPHLHESNTPVIFLLSPFFRCSRCAFGSRLSLLLLSFQSLFLLRRRRSSSSLLIFVILVFRGGKASSIQVITMPRRKLRHFDGFTPVLIHFIEEELILIPRSVLLSQMNWQIKQFCHPTIVAQSLNKLGVRDAPISVFVQNFENALHVLKCNSTVVFRFPWPGEHIRLRSWLWHRRWGLEVALCGREKGVDGLLGPVPRTWSESRWRPEPPRTAGATHAVRRGEARERWDGALRSSKRHPRWSSKRDSWGPGWPATRTRKPRKARRNKARRWRRKPPRRWGSSLWPGPWEPRTLHLSDGPRWERFLQKPVVGQCFAWKTLAATVRHERTHSGRFDQAGNCHALTASIRPATSRAGRTVVVKLNLLQCVGKVLQLVALDPMFLRREELFHTGSEVFHFRFIIVDHLI